jgi:hypothetical protein
MRDGTVATTTDPSRRALSTSSRIQDYLAPLFIDDEGISFNASDRGFCAL